MTKPGTLEQWKTTLTRYVGVLLALSGLAGCSTGPDRIIPDTGRTRAWNLLDGTAVFAGQTESGLSIRTLGGSGPLREVARVGSTRDPYPLCGNTTPDGVHWLIFGKEDRAYIWNSGNGVVWPMGLKARYSNECTILPDSSGAWYEFKEAVYRIDKTSSEPKVVFLEDARLVGTSSDPFVWHSGVLTHLRKASDFALPLGVQFALFYETFGSAGRAVMLVQSRLQTGDELSLVYVANGRVVATESGQDYATYTAAGGVPGAWIFGGQTTSYGLMRFWEASGREIERIRPDSPGWEANPLLGAHVEHYELLLVDGVPTLMNGPYLYELD